MVFEKQTINFLQQEKDSNPMKMQERCKYALAPEEARKV